MEIVQRIKELVELKAKSKRDFASLIGMEQVTFNNYMIGKRGLSYEVIDAILDAFPEVSAEWLLRGEGEMLKGEDASIDVHTSADSNLFKELYENAQLEIRKLNREIGALESEVESLKSKIPHSKWVNKIKPTGTSE